MVTVKEIAKKTGYSTTTVSRLLNKDPELSVSESTKTKIISTAHQLGYFTGSNASKQDSHFALVYSYTPEEELQNAYFETLKKKIISIAQINQIQLDAFNDVSTAVKKFQDVQGFIGIGDFSSEELENLHRQIPNGVFIDSNPAPHYFDSVQPNLSQTIKDALDVAVKDSVKTIGFIGGTGTQIAGQNIVKDIREITFTSYAEQLGVYDEQYVFASGNFTTDNGYRLGLQIAKKKLLPECFIVASDTISVGVLQAFNENGIIVPRDTKIISINNSDIAKYVSAPLTTFNIDQDELCQIAISTLEDAIKNRYKHKQHILVNTDLIQRKSYLSKS